MNMPGFNAESSLGASMGIYRVNAVFGGSSGIGEVSMQQFGASLRGFSAAMKCCGWNTFLHRFLCTTRVVYPFQQCECVEGPGIICRPVPSFPFSESSGT